MNKFPFYERSLLGPALAVSASIHVLLIGIGGWVADAPYLSVMQAPNTPEITVVNQPVVSVIEEEIVFEEIIENDMIEEVVFSNQSRETDYVKDEPALAPSLESRGAVTKAEPLLHVNPAPAYPAIARKRGWEGIVRLDVLVQKDGIPGDVGVQESSGYDVLDSAALQTVKKWKFSPARSGAIKFSSKVTIPIQFTLVTK